MEKYNLMNLEVKELPYHETSKISGGFGVIAALSIIGACIYLYNNRADFVAGVKDGFNGVEYNY